MNFMINSLMCPESPEDILIRLRSMTVWKERTTSGGDDDGVRFRLKCWPSRS